MYVCVCNGVKDSQVREVGSRGVVDAEALVKAFHLDDPESCGRCFANVAAFQALARGELEPSQFGAAFWDPELEPSLP